MRKTTKNIVKQDVNRFSFTGEKGVAAFPILKQVTVC